MDEGCLENIEPAAIQETFQNNLNVTSQKRQKDVLTNRWMERSKKVNKEAYHDKHSFANISAIFEKIQTAPMEYSEAGGALIHQKKT